MNLRVNIIDGSHKGLTRDFRVNPDSCGGDGSFYEKYLCYQADENADKDGIVTHVIIDSAPTSERIAGYITLQANGINTPNNTGEMASFSAIEIVKLAVDINYERCHVGTLMLKYAVHIANTLRKKYIGVDYIITCAAEESVGFYENYGFVKFDEYYLRAGTEATDLDLPNNISMKLRLP